MPTRPRSHQTGDVAETVAKEAFLRAGWIVSKLQSDYGYDLLLRAVQGHTVLPDLALVQVKGTATRRQEAGLSCRVRIGDLRDWIANPIPVFLCAVDASTREVFVRNVDDVAADCEEKVRSAVGSQSTLVRFARATKLTVECQERLRREVRRVWARVRALHEHLRHASADRSPRFAGAHTGFDSTEFFDLQRSWTPAHALAIAAQLGVRLEFLKFRGLRGGTSLARGLIAAYSSWFFPPLLIVGMSLGRDALETHSAIRVTSLSRGADRIDMPWSFPVSWDRIDGVKGTVGKRQASLKWHPDLRDRRRGVWWYTVGSDEARPATIAYGMVAVPVEQRIGFATVLSDHLELLPFVAATLGAGELTVEMLTADRVLQEVPRAHPARKTPQCWWRVAVTFKDVEVVESFCPASIPMHRRRWHLIVRDKIAHAFILANSKTSLKRFLLATRFA